MNNKQLIKKLRDNAELAQDVSNILIKMNYLLQQNNNFIY